MKHNQFHWEHASVPKRSLSPLLQKALFEVKRAKNALKKKYKTDYASLYAPHDMEKVKEIEKLARKYKDVQTIIVAGIGGSNLGTLAIMHAFRGREHNNVDDKEIYFAGTVDALSMQSLNKIIQRKQKQRKKVLLIGVSKSGGTTETIVNFQTLLSFHKKQKNWQNYTVCITRPESKFSKAATKLGLVQLEHPEKVGGRYSVFTVVGLFPLCVLGVPIRELLRGARDVQQDCLSTFALRNPAALSAAIQYYHYKKGKNISNLFLYNPNLEYVGKWYRQLIAESVGKKHNRSGKRIVHAGITPVISVPADLHATVQLYFGGPKDKYTQFVTVGNHADKAKIPRLKEFTDVVKDVQGKTLTEVMKAIELGVHLTYKKLKLPHTKVELERLDAYNIGGFLQYKMLEIIYLAYLMDVYPFDQPGVELYKKETRKILQTRS